MSRLRPVVMATVAYLAVTLAYTWPLPLHLRHGVVHDPLDPILVTWILWWTTQAVPLTTSWWNAPIFYPSTGAFAFSEHMLGLAPIAAPIILATASPLLAYNVSFLATYVLSALGAYFLACTLTRRHDAAFVAGLAFAFAPYRVSQLPHLQVLSAFYTPLCLAALHRYDRRPKAIWAAVAAAAWLLQGLSTGYFLFFLSVLVGLWLAWFATGRWTRRQVLVVTACFAVAALILLPSLLGYKRILTDTYGFSRGIGAARSFGADIASLLEASPDLWLWGWVRVMEKPEGELFPGITIVVLAIYALTRDRTAPRVNDDGGVRSKWVPRVFAIVAIAFAIAALLPALFGSRQLTIGGVRIASVARADKPFTVAVYSALAWLCTRPAIRRAWTSRSAPAFYAFAAVLTWMLALGPSPEFMGHRAIYQAPYAALMLVPGFEGLRVPARFWMMSLVCLSVLAAFAIDRTRGRARQAITVVAAVGLLLDGWIGHFPLRAEPAVRPTPAGVSVRLDLPMNDLQNAAALHQQTQHGVPLFNGYSGYDAPQQAALRELLNAGDARILQALTRQRTIGVVIDHLSDGDGTARKLVTLYTGAVIVESHDDWSSYRLPANESAEPIPDVAGQPVQIKSVHADPKGADAGRAIDGRLDTRWSAGPQRQPAELSAELAEPASIHQIALYLGNYATEFPARLQIDVSTNGRDWETVWTGDTALQAYYGSLRRPQEIPLVFEVARANVRFVRLRQVGERTRDDWSIAELKVLR